jgi:hypothetical protein
MDQALVDALERFKIQDLLPPLQDQGITLEDLKDMQPEVLLHLKTELKLNMSKFSRLSNMIKEIKAEALAVKAAAPPAAAEGPVVDATPPDYFSLLPAAFQWSPQAAVSSPPLVADNVTKELEEKLAASHATKELELKLTAKAKELEEKLAAQGAENAKLQIKMAQLEAEKLAAQKAQAQAQVDAAAEPLAEVCTLDKYAAKGFFSSVCKHCGIEKKGHKAGRVSGKRVEFADIGARVQRGPDWYEGDDDGGAGSLGTLTQAGFPSGFAYVRWDAGPNAGKELNYRVGGSSGGKFELQYA